MVHKMVLVKLSESQNQTKKLKQTKRKDMKMVKKENGLLRMGG